MMFSAVFLNDSAQASYEDFNESAGGGKEVMYLSEKGIIFGYPDGTFRPEQHITRLQAVVMIGRAFGWKTQSTKQVFTDVAVSNPSNAFIVEAFEKGIVSGYQDGTFRPGEILSRAQMSAFLNRAFDYKIHFTSSFKDVSANHWARNDIQAVASNGIVLGYGNEVFQPDTFTSRKHFSMMLSRAIEPSFVPTILLRVEVGSSLLNVRTNPSASSPILGKIQNGDVVEFTPTNVTGWGKVSFNGLEGYASLSYLKQYIPGSLPLQGKIIVLDAGHGGYDQGASSKGLIEKEINLKTAFYLKQELAKMGATVFMTRESDKFISLEDRARFAENIKGSIFVSIHTNSSESGAAHGTETYYNDQVYKGDVNPYPAESKKLAALIQKELAKLPTKDIGYKQNEYHILRRNSVPGVLVELAFLNNSADATLLKSDSFLKQSANLIGDGILNYYK